jgi:hypothetical protein
MHSYVIYFPRTVLGKIEINNMQAHTLSLGKILF